MDFYHLSETLIRLRMALHFRLSKKSPREAPKIFVVGHPRTGTTSLHRLFLAAGKTSIHRAADWPTSQAECFSDYGHCRPIRQLADYYARARFVLNCRPVRNHLLSLGAYYDRSFSARTYRYELRRRLRHFDNVLDVLGQGDRLIVVNIERPGAMGFVAEQLGLQLPPAQTSDTKHNRARRHPTERTRRNVDEALAAIGARGDEPLLVQGASASRSHEILKGLEERGRVFL